MREGYCGATHMLGDGFGLLTKIHVQNAFTYAVMGTLFEFKMFGLYFFNIQL